MQEVVQHWDDGTDETMQLTGKRVQWNDLIARLAESIWDDVLEFAFYAFNKSHSVGYAILVMQDCVDQTITLLWLCPTS